VPTAAISTVSILIFNLKISNLIHPHKRRKLVKILKSKSQTFLSQTLRKVSEAVVLSSRYP
jgi:hypothetical protein